MVTRLDHNILRLQWTYNCIRLERSSLRMGLTGDNYLPLTMFVFNNPHRTPFPYSLLIAEMHELPLSRTPSLFFTAPRRVRMQPTDSDTSASQRSLCCVRFPTDSAVCLWASGSCQGFPGGTHSWKVIEFEGEKTAEGRGEDSTAAEGNDCGGGRAKGCRGALHGDRGSSFRPAFVF